MKNIKFVRIFLLVVIIIGLGLLATQKLWVPKVVNMILGPESGEPQIIGGDKDAHGCLGPAGYSWCEVKNKCLRVWEEKCEAKPVVSTPITNNGYSFKIINKTDNSDFPKYYLEIYQGKNLLNEVILENVNVSTKSDNFVISPDKNYVAFPSGLAEGGCVQHGFPVIVDLNTFSVLSLDNSNLDKEVENILGYGYSRTPNPYGILSVAKSVKWLNANEIQVVMSFGEEDVCRVSEYSNRKDMQNEGKIVKTINFKIIK